MAQDFASKFGGTVIAPSPAENIPAAADINLPEANDFASRFGGNTVSQAPPDVSGTILGQIPTYEQFAAQYKEQANASPFEKLKSLSMAPVAPIKAFGQSLADILNGVQGVSEVAGQQSALPQSVPQAVGNTAAIAGRSGIEGARQFGFDINSLPGAIANLIQKGAVRVQQNPIQTAVNTVAPATLLFPSNPSEQEIQNAYQALVYNAGLQSGKNLPQNQLVQGEINPQIAKGVAQAIPYALPFAAAPRSALASTRAGIASLQAAVPRVGNALADAIVSSPEYAARAAQSAGRGVAAPFRRVAARGIIRQPLSAAITEAIGITPIEGSADIAPVVKSSILEANAGRISSGMAPQQLLQKAMDFKISQYQAGLKLAGQQGLRHSTDSLIQAMRNNLERLHGSIGAANIDRIIGNIRREHPNIFDKKYITPSEGQEFAAQINREVNSKNPNRVPKISEQLNAETALSQELSRQGSEMYQASTGTLGTPNQDYGVLKEARDGFENEIKIAQNADAGKRPGGSHIPTTPTGLAVKAVKKVGGRALIATNQENVVDAFNRMLSEAPSRPNPGVIDPAYQQAIIQQYTPSVVPPVLPQAPASTAPAASSLNAGISGSPRTVMGTPIAASAQSPQFSPDTLAALKKLGVKPSNPNYEQIGNALEQRAEVITKKKEIEKPQNELSLKIDSSINSQTRTPILYKSPPDPKLLTRSVESSDLPTPDNVNSIDWYHGSSATNLTPETIDPVGVGKSNSLFGLGFYVTDDPAVAKSYQIGKSKGAGNIYKINTENIRNILNFDKPLPQDAIDIIEKSVYKEFEDVIKQASAEKGATGASVWKKLTEAIQEDSHQNEIPASNYEEMFQTIQGNLRQAGYDAITHVGGNRAGKGIKTHKVLILLDPNDFSGYAGSILPKTISSVEKISLDYSKPRNKYSIVNPPQ